MTDKELLKKVTTLLKKQKLTVATAESCTGGLIAHTLTNISGSSEYFDRGIISYSKTAKMELLHGYTIGRKMDGKAFRRYCPAFDY